MTVENKKVQEATGATPGTCWRLSIGRRCPPSEFGGYASGLGGRLEEAEPRDEGLPHVIGYVTVINGKVSSADVYASHELLTKVWPKLLNSAAVEAFAEVQKDKTFYPVAMVAVKAVIEDIDAAKPEAKEVSGACSAGDASRGTS